MKLLLATHNPGKLASYKQKFAGFKLELVTLDEAGIKEVFEENKATFEENARDKALFYYNLSKLPTLAEDGGFEIDYLNGEPGVRTRRWMGHEATDEELVENLKKVVPTIPVDKRSARFVAVSCLVKSPKEVYVIRNTKEGYLTEDFRDTYPEGFPYRSCFMSSVFNKHVEDLTEKERSQISHRLKNIEELKKYF